ncbi:hypothetical protein K3495_g3050 [Podosphaera aphanis]|nr:hypothetical protein K3495_g3050 [Podosphaera aphanis]
MKLTRLQEQEPPRRPGTVCVPEAMRVAQQGCAVAQPERGSDDKLRRLLPRDVDKRLRDARKGEGTDKRARHDAREGKMVVGPTERVGDPAGWKTVVEDIVGRLQIEGFLDFGVRCDEQMDEHQQRKQAAEPDI